MPAAREGAPAFRPRRAPARARRSAWRARSCRRCRPTVVRRRARPRPRAAERSPRRARARRALPPPRGRAMALPRRRRAPAAPRRSCPLDAARPRRQRRPRRHRRCVRAASGSGHAPRSRARSAGRRTATIRSPGSQRGFPLAACRRAAGEALRARSRAGPPALRSRPSRRARRAARRSPTDASRCRLAPAEHGVQPVLAVQRVAARSRLAPVAGARHVIEIAAACALHADCRRPSRHCAAARDAPDSSASATAG